MKDSALVPIDIEISLPSGRESPIDDALIESRVSDRVLDLLNDLGFPAQPKIRVSHKTFLDPLGNARSGVAIEGRLCRQEVSPPPQDDTNDVDGSIHSISMAVYLNRHLLLTGRLLSKLAESHRLQAVAILPELVRRGCSLEIAENIVTEIDPRLPEQSRTYQMELAIANRFPPSVTVEAGPRLHNLMTGARGQLRQMLGLMRDGLFYELGIKFPPFRLSCNKALADFEFRAHIGWVRGPIQKTLRANEFMVNDSLTNLLERLKIEGRSARNPANGMPCTIVVGEESAKRCENEGRLTTWDWAGYVVLSLAQILRSNVEVFLTVTEAQRTLSRLSEAFPLPIVDLLERFSPSYIVGVLRELVREGFSLRDLRSVMEAMLEINGELASVPEGSIALVPPIARLSRFPVRRPKGLSPEECAEYVRMSMKRYLTYKHAREGELNVIQTTSSTEARLRRTAGVIPQPEHEDLIRTVGKVLKKTEAWTPTAILTSFDVRRRLREAIEIEFPHLPVLSREEIDNLAVIRNRGSIVWE